MNRLAPDGLLQEVSRLLQARAGTAQDGELLRRFLDNRDEEAFAELVRRHGALVLGVARRVVGHAHDAEDVFQATFLVLARKADSVRRAASLAAWLHGVAARLGQKAVVAAARRRHRERQAALPLLAPPRGDPELEQRLHAEIASLPEALRLPLVLCALEGRPQEQAARQLGCPHGTLKARLQRAREVLRRRLQRAGLAVSSLPALPALAEPVPQRLADATVRLAFLVARGPVKDCTGAGALALAGGGNHLMFWARGKAVLAALVVAGFVGAGTLLLRPGPNAPAAAAPVDKCAGSNKDLYGDPLPPKALVRLGTGRFRDPLQVSWGTLGLAFSRDGSTLLSVGDGSLCVWDAQTGRPLRHLSTHGLHVRGAALSPDRRLVAIAGFEFPKDNQPAAGLVRILEVATGKEVRRMSRGPERTDHASLAFTPDGKMLASLGGGGIVRLEEVATGAELLRSRFPADIMGAIALSADGSQLAVATGPNTRKVFVWEWQAGKAPREIKASPRGARSVAFSPDGTVLATGDNGQEGIRLWAVADGRLLRRLGGLDGWGLHQVCFSPDGKYIAGTSRKGLRLWDPKTGKEVRRMAGLRSGASFPVFSADSRRLAALGDGVLRVWDVATGKELHPYPDAHLQAPSFVALLAGGAAVTAADDGAVRVWDSATGRQRRKFDLADDMVRAVAVSPDGRWLATSELGSRHAVRLWDLRTGRAVYRLAGHGRLGGRRALAFTPDGKRLASWGDDMYLRLWDVAKGKAVAEHEVRPNGKPIPGDEQDFERRFLGEGRFSRDGSLLAFEENGFFLFDSKTGKQKITFPNEGGHVIGLAASPDGKHLLASTWGKSRVIRLTDGRRRFTTEPPLVCLYEIATGKVALRIPLTGERIGPSAFSPDGKTIAVSIDRRILLYDSARGTARGTIDGLPGTAHSLALAPDGKRLIAGLSDTTAVIWNLPGK
jgi:RNA polymerase sigma factor (sigma-70 family)